MTLDLPTSSVKPPRRHLLWWRVMLTAFGFYLLGLVILVFTGNPNLFPTVVLLGSFMVPATYVAFLYDHRHVSRLSVTTTALCFFYGGILGVFAAAVLEPIFISQLDFLTAFQAAAIEELVKIFGVLLIARHWRHDRALDGLILGAAAGMGFAALESTGYAFTAFLESRGSLSLTVGVMLLRGLLSPLGHGTWTAILACVLFREGRATHFHIDLKLVGAYLTVVLLHGLWDGVPSLIANFVSSGLDVFIAEAVVGAAGLLILWRLWRQATRLQISEAVEAGAEAEAVEALAVEVVSEAERIAAVGFEQGQTGETIESNDDTVPSAEVA